MMTSVAAVRLITMMLVAIVALETADYFVQVRSCTKDGGQGSWSATELTNHMC